LALKDYIKRPRKEWTEKEWIQEAQIMIHSPWISEDDRDYWKDTLKNLRTKEKTIKEG